MSGRTTNDEETLLRTFVDPARGERLVRFLSSRQRLREELGQLRELDRRYARRVPDEQHSPAEIERVLRTLGAPARCQVLSEDEDLDGLVLELSDALEWVYASGRNTFLSCIPGRLAYFEGRSPGERYVLERPASGDAQR